MRPLSWWRERRAAKAEAGQAAEAAVIEARVTRWNAEVRERQGRARDRQRRVEQERHVVDSEGPGVAEVVLAAVVLDAITDNQAAEVNQETQPSQDAQVSNYEGGESGGGGASDGYDSGSSDSYDSGGSDSSSGGGDQ